MTLESYSGSNILYESDNAINITFTSTVLNVSLSTSSQVASVNSNYTITIRTQQVIPKGGMIRIQLPNFNDGSGSKTIDSMISSTVTLHTTSVTVSN